ncbi:hypothetical protein V495_06354 [Pseudogymnoascus sp. VKM F-4514 (FW-929)]|nr:hypothetical protein V495_06354 [Pseudogymnoascus sp. VKM F-4514 (FW-929)]KFY68088.1 hypothetical protein V497_00028 [Pseudogymnoascus sp. VKM F-4516 (FW-969)]
MTPHAQEPTTTTSDGAAETHPETNTMPALMSPKAPLQPDFPAPDEVVVQATTLAETIAAPDTKAEVEHQTELAGKPAAIISNENGDNHGHIETANLEIEDSVWSTESQVAAPDNGGPATAVKKKKKSSGKKKKPTPTGFEEFYADPPITPEDHKEEVEQLYHHARPFAERIETCIQRYHARRKLDEHRANIFNKYLSLGGIDTTMKAFTGGVDNETLEDFDGPTIADINATDVMFSGDGSGSKFYDPSEPQNWVVDFEGIAKAFLSSSAPYNFGIHNQELVHNYCNVVKNFLNYVLMHGVCPEYTKSIITAQKICDLAKSELPAIHDISASFPGNFHKALSIICHGYYRLLYVDPDSIPDRSADADPNEYMSIDHAHRTFRAAMALMGTDAQCAAIAATSLEEYEAPTVIDEELSGFEVVSMILPSETLRNSFSGIRAADGRTGTINPLGLLICKPWVHPCQATLDLTVLEERERAAHPPVYSDETFWVDEDILESCFVGMKFVGVVRTLDMGVKYLDNVTVIYASFYTFVENERMINWKPPRENERLPPSCEDGEVPDAEGEGDGLEE